MEKLVDNKLLTVAGRIAIVVATAALPVIATLGGKLAWNILDNIEAVSKKVDDTGVKLQLLDQSVNFGVQSNKTEFGNVRAQLSDHEGRLRLIERGVPR